MSSSNGTEYYLKSMNGIKSFDDGSGTVIEDDSITINTIECTGNINTDTISSTGSISATQILCNNFQGTGSSGAGTDMRIGNDNSKTSAVYLGKEEETILGTIYPAIPVKSNYYPIVDNDLCNKLYVDSATSGTNVLSLSNNFTGATNTFVKIKI